MKKLINIEVSKRLREFAESHYSSITDFANALEMMPQTLNLYLSGRSLPGNNLQKKLRALGCDIEWLMTGSKGTERGTPPVSQESLLMLDKLRAMGIDSLAKLETFCDPKNIAADIAVLLHERMVEYKTKNQKHK